MKLGVRELRSGMVFNRIKASQLDDTKVENSVHIALSGQWSPNASTYQCDYLHPAFFNSLYSHVVRPASASVLTH